MDVFELIRVAEVMDRTPPIVPAETTLSALADLIAQADTPIARRQATLIVRDGRLAGIVTRGDLLRAQRAADATELTVLGAGTADPVTAFPDETIDEAMGKMLRRDIGRLPVVERDDPSRIVGYLGRAEILAARLRQQKEEQRREKGPWFSGAKRLP